MTTQAAPGPVVCQVCAAKTGDDGLLCRIHSGRLTRELAEIPGLLLELEITTTRQDRVTVGSGVGRSAERPLTWNEHAAGRRDVLLETLAAWGVAPADLAPCGPSGGSGPGAVVRGLRVHPDAGQAYDELCDAVRGVRQAIDRPDVATRFYAGPCPEQVDAPGEPDGEGNPGAGLAVSCDGEVWAFIPVESDTPAMLRCRTHKAHRWDTTQWLRVGHRMLARMAELRGLARPA